MPKAKEKLGKMIASSNTYRNSNQDKILYLGLGSLVSLTPCTPVLGS